LCMPAIRAVNVHMIFMNCWRTIATENTIHLPKTTIHLAFGTILVKKRGLSFPALSSFPYFSFKVSASIYRLRVKILSAIMFAARCF
jgi:hypothetical protein